MMYGWGWDGGGINIFGMVIMMIFWAAVIVGIVWLVVWLVRQPHGGAGGAGTPAGGGAPGESALDILKKRYARGEIDKAEFKEKKKDLT